ncbi:hypothetical protein BN1080_00731 [Planococcus massiliensis]|uniref:Uncharacterized protein n=1 Tax=Planococcus massiliensis TaxID=1499687 RepID=A0A098EHS3_9BACL|nr:hypothetical protein [Planococcus massiliensis]CEG21813.1 hypothetical protein BN1080_00731 [Planococcus massiliensis]
MATKLKNDFWSIVAVVIALFSLAYCLSFIFELLVNFPAADLMASLRALSKGDA